MIIHYFIFEMKALNSIGFSYLYSIENESIKIAYLYIVSRLVCKYDLKKELKYFLRTQCYLGRLRYIISIDQKASRFLDLFSQ